MERAGLPGAGLGRAAGRRASLDQALASTRLEGHVPTPEFLADCEDYIAGRIAREDAMARGAARARTADVERWLRDDVAPVYDATKAKPDRKLSTRSVFSEARTHYASHKARR